MRCILRSESDVSDLLRYGERETLEVKDASGGLPKSVWETYSAFANTIGGVILLGIKEYPDETDFEKRFVVSHLKNPERLVREFWNTLNSAKVSASLLADGDVEMIPYRGATIVAIHVPQANYSQRPVYVNDNPFRGSFKRNYEGDYHCTASEVKAMLRDVNDSGNDGTLIENYTIDDIDSKSLQAYRNEYRVRNPDHVWNALDDGAFLRNLGCLALDRSSGKEWLTMAGLLMFGKGLSIRERFDNIRLDYLDFTNLLPGSRWSDRLTYDGTWENNLYNFFRLVMPRLSLEVKRPFVMVGDTRIDDTPVHKAIREAMVNLIIHCDFLLSGVLRVEKRDNRLVFINPGRLKLPVHAIYTGGISKARNPRIQNMFRMIGIGETIGSGFPTILAAWRGENWRNPELRENFEAEQVELTLWMVSLLPEWCTSALHDAFGDAYAGLTADEQKILCAAVLEGEITNTRLQPVIGLHPAGIGRLLSGLTAQGYLLRESNGRWTTYRVNVSSRGNGAGEGAATPQVTPQADGITPQVTPQAGGATPQVTPQADGITPQVTPQADGITPQVAPHVRDLLECLGDGIFSVSELMGRLGLTNRKYFREGYLAPALKAKVITMTIPEKPHSPKQKYRKVILET